ncbi:MAG: C40 family peptidase [Armatimonadetes bacterium]|nr:C40 family peptidase [Armatimonadota bacterium]
MKKILILCAFLFVFSTGTHAEDRPTLPPGAVFHALSQDEDWEALSARYRVPASAIQDANPGATPTPGTPIVIPPPAFGWPTHRVQRGETLWRISKLYGVPLEQLRQANRLQEDQLLVGDALDIPGGAQGTALQPGTMSTSPAMSVSAAPSGTTATGSRPTPRPATSAAPASSAAPPSPTTTASAAPGTAAHAPPGESGPWVEVRLADGRRAWAMVDQLIVGSWQPLGPEAVVALAQRLQGVPYRFGGVTPNGLDCSAFVQEVFRLGGHQVPRMADDQYRFMREIDPDAMLPGDLVFFSTYLPGPSHVGIYLGDGRFVHASSSRGVVESRLDETYYASCYLGARRLPAWAEPLSGPAARSQAEIGSLR